MQVLQLLEPPETGIKRVWTVLCCKDNLDVFTSVVVRAAYLLILLLNLNLFLKRMRVYTCTASNEG
jgi:hypothetical protein